MQQSIIAGILLRSVSKNSFALLPSSPIFSFACFSIHAPKADFFSPSGPVIKCIDGFCFDFGVGITGGTNGTEGWSVGGVAAFGSGGAGTTGGIPGISGS